MHEKKNVSTKTFISKNDWNSIILYDSSATLNIPIGDELQFGSSS
jgi:hypothetical protein